MHRGRNSKLTVHGDDFLVVASCWQLKWVEARLKDEYDRKAEMLGPEQGAKTEARILNRTLRWKQDKIEYEAVRHPEL